MKKFPIVNVSVIVRIDILVSPRGRVYDSLCNYSHSVLPTVSGNEMASFGRPWIRRTKRLTFSNTGTFGEYKIKKDFFNYHKRILCYSVEIKRINNIFS